MAGYLYYLLLLGCLTVSYGQDSARNNLGTGILGLPALPALFPPGPCLGATSGAAGQCQRSCDDSSGAPDGPCAFNQGICCVSTSKCSSNSLTNNTFFSNDEYPGESTTSQSCSTTIRKLLNVVEIRLELLEFLVGRPDSNGRCSDDSLVVEGLNPGFVLPRLCGNLSNQHLILPVDKVAFNGEIVIRFALSGTSSKWLVKIVQIESNNPNVAPSGCLQYHLGTNGSITSFNFDVDKNEGLGSIQGLRYAICFRPEAGFCSIRFDPIYLRSRRSPGYSYQSSYHGAPTKHKYQARYPVRQYKTNYKTYPKKTYHRYVAKHGYRPSYQIPYDSMFNYYNTSDEYIVPLHPVKSTTGSPGETTTVVTESTTEGTTENSTQVTTETSTQETTEGTTEQTTAETPIEPLDTMPCEHKDSILFPPSNLFCADSGARTLILNIRPFIVFIDNRGASPSRGFHFRFNHMPC